MRRRVVNLSDNHQIKSKIERAVGGIHFHDIVVLPIGREKHAVNELKTEHLQLDTIPTPHGGALDGVRYCRTSEIDSNEFVIPECVHGV